MSTDDFGRLAYLGLLGAVLVGWYLMQNRGGLGKMAQHAAAWVFIFVGVVAVIGLWGDIRQNVSPRAQVIGDMIEVPRGPDGHYALTLDVNGVPVNFLVDTGATHVVLTREDAERAGLRAEDLIFASQARTANGVVQTAPVMLDRVSLGTIEHTRVPALVNGGDLHTSLLGMSYLERYGRIEIGGGTLVLER